VCLAAVERFGGFAEATGESIVDEGEFEDAWFGDFRLDFVVCIASKLSSGRRWELFKERRKSHGDTCLPIC
jgi:hypothetical protein